MQAIGTIRVVLGEGEPGQLRLVLEAQGFEVIGHARDDDELLRVLDVTSPTVVVLDAGISVLAASAVELRAAGAPIVVVWPQGVFTPLAAERVEPTRALLELGNAVRRAAARRTPDEPIRIPDVEPKTDPIDVPLVPRSAPRVGRGKRHVLVAISAWVLALTALGAIGVAVPRVFSDPDRTSDERPSAIDRRARERVNHGGEAEGTPVTDLDDGGAPAACSPDRNADPEPGSGKGCGKGNPTGQTGKGRKDPKPGKGRPDDPGKGNGKGRGAGADENAGANEVGVEHGGRSTGGPGDGNPGQGGGRDGSSDGDATAGAPADPGGGKAHGKNGR